MDLKYGGDNYVSVMKKGLNDDHIEKILKKEESKGRQSP